MSILETLDSGCGYQMQEWDLDPKLSSSSLPKHKHKYHWNIENYWEVLHFLCKELRRLCCSKFFHGAGMWCFSIIFWRLTFSLEHQETEAVWEGWPVFSTHFFKEHLCASNTACVTETSEIVYSFKRLSMSFWKMYMEIISVWKIISCVCRIVTEENIILRHTKKG